MSDPIMNTDATAGVHKRGRFGRIFISLIKSAFLLLVVLLLAGVTYEYVGRWQDEHRFPKEGQRVDIGGRKLNLNCTGQGTPTVILDSGLGVPASGWKAVQVDVEKFTRVCSYDRAGTGWSDSGPLPRTSAQIAKELHALLQNAGVAPPYVLVGHSLGGFNVRMYNAEYPGEVAGVVLVDASHEEAESRASESMKKAEQQQKAQMSQMLSISRIAIPIGIGRMFLKRSWKEPLLPPGFRSPLAYQQLESGQLEGMINELNSFQEDARQVSQAGGFGDKPLVVLTAGREPVAAEVPPGVSKKDYDDYHKAFANELQPKLARLSTQGKQVMVPESGHMIPMEKPQAVVDAVREVCDSVRAR
jgi:pimeloyl-ACP methyl ester carboxylesterase